MKKVMVLMWLAVCLLAVVGMAGAQGPAATTSGNPDPDLVSKLTKELNITPEQATGGAGAIFAFAKSRLNPADFSKVAGAIPGIDGFLKAAPAAGEGSSALGPLGSMAGGGAGSLTSLTNSFSSLGLSPAMIIKFLPVLESHIKSKGGANASSIFGGIFK
jgi:hypothetical protein